jgi:hypothetical protein
MNEDDILEEALKDPEVVSAGEEFFETFKIVTEGCPSSARSSIEAFAVCAEVFKRMKEKKKEEPKNPTGRRAAVEHTKRKIKDGEN